MARSRPPLPYPTCHASQHLTRCEIPQPRWWVQAYGDDTGTTVAAHLPPLRLGQKLKAAWPWVRPWLHGLIKWLVLVLLQQDTPDVA